MKWKKDDIDHNALLTTMYRFYDSVPWLPITRNILIDEFGQDIAKVIVYYLKAIKL